MKTCTKCHRELPEESFSKCSSRPDGLQPYCKECTLEYNRQLAKLRKEAATAVGGNLKRIYVNPDLARFTPRQLMEELRARGYTGELKYVQTIKI